MPDALSLRCAACGGVNRVRPDKLASHPTCGRCKQPLDAGNTPHDLDDDALAKLIRTSPVPVLVDFWAPWCGPCRTMAPHLVSFAAKHAGRVIVAKVDVDRHQRTYATLGVQAVPTLALYSGGSLKVREPGARMGPQLEAFVAPYLG